MKETRASRILGTVFFKHKYLTNPAASPADAIVAAANNLKHALTSNRSEQHKSQQSFDDLKRIATIITDNFKQQTTPTTVEEVTAPSPRVPETAPSPRVAETASPPRVATVAPSPRVPVDIVREVDTSPPARVNH